MCVAFIAWRYNSDFPLIVASNRDEFYKRSSSVLSHCKDTDIFAGRDLEQGGTWFGITKTGRFSLITNYRDPSEFSRKAKSRGHLVLDYLKSNLAPKEYLKNIGKKRSNYNGFNLIVGNTNELYYYSNRQDVVQKLVDGIYGLSNAFLDTKWPKVQAGKENIQKIIKNDAQDVESYFQLLGNETIFSDDILPDTGIGLEKERVLSSIFIKSPEYGTKSSNALLVDKNKFVSLVERTWQPPKKSYKDVSINFQIENDDLIFTNIK